MSGKARKIYALTVHLQNYATFIVETEVSLSFSLLNEKFLKIIFMIVLKLAFRPTHSTNELETTKKPFKRHPTFLFLIHTAV